MIPTAVLRDSATIEANLGETAYVRLDAGPVTVPCNVFPTRRLMHTGDGNAVECVATMYLRPNVAIAPQDEVTIDGVSYRVLSVATQSNLTRADFLVVGLGRSET